MYVCSYKARDLTVVMGNANRLTPDHQQLQYNVQQIIKHQGYNTTSFINDIALLFINGYIPWDWPTVKAVQLNTKESAVYSMCKISGWGDMGNVRKHFFNIIQILIIIFFYSKRVNYR